MIKNYLIIAWRNLLRNKTYSFINLAGLAIGLSCFLLIALYVSDELSFDRYNEQAANIYRVNADAHWGGQDIHMAQISDMTGPLLKKDNPQVQQYTRIFDQLTSKCLVKRSTGYITENNIAYVDSTFFDIFTLPAVDGDTKTALDQPGTIVITRSTAMKYFGISDVVGKTLEIKVDDKTVSYKINAVINDIPANSSFHFDILFSMKSLDYQWGQIGNGNFYTYLLLRPGTDPRSFEKMLDEYVIRYLVPEFKSFNIHSMAEFERAGNRFKYSLMPLTNIHLHANQVDELSPPGSIQYVYIFSAVALFILLIACVNFMNLTTARSAGRAKEVGIRKVLGTGRKELIGQFLTESILMVAFSLLIAFFIAWLVLPLFNGIAGKKMALDNLLTPWFLLLLAALPFVVGMFAGSYPAFFLSSFRPIEVLKGKLRLGSRSIGLRSTLVVFQFATSIFLIIGTLVVYQQLHYIQHANLGFNKDQVLIINGTDALGNKAETFRQEMLRLPGVKKGTGSAFLPVANSARNAGNISSSPVSTATSNFNLQTWQVDYDYLETMGMTLSKGRNFSPGFGSDKSAVIINETAEKILGYANPIGKSIYGVNSTGQPIAYPIIGVVKNFNYESVHQEVGPLLFMLSGSSGLVSLKVNAANIPQIISRAEDKWKAMAPGMPFSYRFMNESFDEMYKSERQVGKIAVIFSVLAIAIACLGIFGLATFMAEQRTREIGIRKILGASVEGIVQLLSRDFVRLVAIAFVIAGPLAWWAMNKWLRDFAFRISISWWVFLAAGAATLLIAMLTVGFQSIRAAIANPVNSLRAE